MATSTGETGPIDPLSVEINPTLETYEEMWSGGVYDEVEAVMGRVDHGETPFVPLGDTSREFAIHVLDDEEARKHHADKAYALLERPADSREAKVVTIFGKGFLVPPELVDDEEPTAEVIFGLGTDFETEAIIAIDGVVKIACRQQSQESKLANAA